MKGGREGGQRQAVGELSRGASPTLETWRAGYGCRPDRCLVQDRPPRPEMRISVQRRRFGYLRAQCLGLCTNMFLDRKTICRKYRARIFHFRVISFSFQKGRIVNVGTTCDRFVFT